MQRSTCNLTKSRADETKSSRNETTMINGRVSRLVFLTTVSERIQYHGMKRAGSKTVPVSSFLQTRFRSFLCSRGCPTVRTYELVLSVAKERESRQAGRGKRKHCIGGSMNDEDGSKQPRNLRQQVLHDGCVHTNIRAAQARWIKCR